MFLKREVIDHLVSNGINKFILIGENILNFHSSDDSYYEDWFYDCEEGWIAAINFQDHVINEFRNVGADLYINFFQGEFINWRNVKPLILFNTIQKTLMNRICNI
jgi:hypothetical protein